MEHGVIQSIWKLTNIEPWAMWSMKTESVYLYRLMADMSPYLE